MSISSIYTNGMEILKSVAITETSLSCQLLERFWQKILNHLNVHLDQVGFIPESQRGFRKPFIFMNITLNKLASLMRRSGAVVRVSDFGPRGPWFEPRPVHISLWP